MSDDILIVEIELTPIDEIFMYFSVLTLILMSILIVGIYEGWNFNSGNYLFTTDTK